MFCEGNLTFSPSLFLSFVQKYTVGLGRPVKVNIPRMKKTHIEESMGILSTKMAEVDVRERSLLTQLREAKDKIITKVSSVHIDLPPFLVEGCQGQDHSLPR
jgi:hypothetical protein